MADVFNVLNSAIVNRAYDAYLGNLLRRHGGVRGQPPQPPLSNEILNPRIFRLGLPASSSEGEDGAVPAAGRRPAYFLMVEMNSSTSGMPPWKMR
ncbi:MAG: hypothetical protein MZV64_11170 [Ignavibacteriales bacterium]|nr:hypothetical protein [Ignavibacteriales bacterium]